MLEEARKREHNHPEEERARLLSPLLDTSPLALGVFLVPFAHERENTRERAAASSSVSLGAKGD